MLQVNTVLLNTYAKNTLYFIVGRTCSGKDTITQEILKGTPKLNTFQGEEINA